MKKKFKNVFIICIALIATFTLLSFVNAEEENVILEETSDCTLEVEELTAIGATDREIRIDVNNTKAGRRITGFQYCYDQVDNLDNDCTDETNWIDIDTYVSPYVNSVGNNEITIFTTVPQDRIHLRATFEDFEPFNISYANYLLETDETHGMGDVYVDGTKDLSNYGGFEGIAEGVNGGDLVLPEDCLNNGCLLKLTFSNNDYAAMKARLDEFNEEYNQEEDYPEFDLASMFNHLESVSSDSVLFYTQNDKVYVEENENTKSIYLIINKFFSETNRANFKLFDNKMRILSPDYIGIDVKIDRKYFDETDGFLTFNEFNNYRNNTVIFYGTPKVRFVVDKLNPISIVDGGNADGIPNLHYPYTKIVSKDPSNYPINDNNELIITSFYNPEYIVPIYLKNDSNETVQEIELELNRYAFGGNAGSLLLVDGDGINCRQEWMNPNCTDENTYVSTTYLGLIDTFYTTGETDVLSSFEISQQQNGLIGDFINNQELYIRNEEFNPWAIAIFYRNDEVVFTRSFDLGELVKTEGFTTEVIPNEWVNGIAITYDNNLITNYNSDDYEIFGYGLGYERPMNMIKYFSRGDYERGKISYTLILGSKTEILENNINRINLFLTNGELKSDEDEFPELMYGVGEGKEFYVDGRTFEELGGGE